jgi:3-oxoacyl-[acyl-carrier-protein] synthase-3
VVLQATDKVEGLLGEKLGCDSDARNTLVVKGMGGRYVNQGRPYGETSWIFEGPEIFKRAVLGMSGACADVLAAQGYKVDDVDVVIPHQANLRIMDAVAKRVGAPADRMFVNVHKYGNMSAATVAVALVEAIEEGRVKPNSLLLLPGFGAGLTWCAHLVRWGGARRPSVRPTSNCAERPHGARDRAGLPDEGGLSSRATGSAGARCQPCLQPARPCCRFTFAW